MSSIRWNGTDWEEEADRQDQAVIDVNYTWLSDEESIPLFRAEVTGKVNGLLPGHLERWRSRGGKVIALPLPRLVSVVIQQ